MKTSTLLKRFVPYYRNYIGIMIMDLFCAALTTVCELVLPLILRYITNIGMNDLASLTIRTIVILGGVYFALRIIDGMASFYMAYTGHVMGASIETDMREDAFAHLQKPVSYTHLTWRRYRSSLVLSSISSPARSQKGRPPKSHSAQI